MDNKSRAFVQFSLGAPIFAVRRPITKIRDMDRFPRRMDGKSVRTYEKRTDMD